MFCLFCGEKGGEVRWDKRGFPFLYCNRCQAKAFLRNGTFGAAMYVAASSLLESDPERLVAMAENIQAQFSSIGVKPNKDRIVFEKEKDHVRR